MQAIEKHKAEFEKRLRAGTQFTCFTSTKVQRLTRLRCAATEKRKLAERLAASAPGFFYLHFFLFSS